MCENCEKLRKGLGNGLEEAIAEELGLGPDVSIMVFGGQPSVHVMLLMSMVQRTASHLADIEFNILMRGAMERDPMSHDILKKLNEQKVLKTRFFEILKYWIHTPDAYYYVNERLGQMHDEFQGSDEAFLASIGDGSQPDKIDMIEGFIIDWKKEAGVDINPD